MIVLLLFLVYNPSGFTMLESELTIKAPVCDGNAKTIPKEVKTEPAFGSGMRTFDNLDLDADGQCDIVAYSQESMDDDGEQVFMFFMSRNKRYVYHSYDMSGRTIKLTPIYLKNGGPPFLVIHKTQSKSSLPDYVVRRWDIKSKKIVTVNFLGFDKLDIEKFNDADATTIMLFYVRSLIGQTAKQLRLGEQPLWLYEEVTEIARRMDSDRYPELSASLIQLSEKMVNTSHEFCFLCETEIK